MEALSEEARRVVMGADDERGTSLLELVVRIRRWSRV